MLNTRISFQVYGQATGRWMDEELTKGKQGWPHGSPDKAACAAKRKLPGVYYKMPQDSVPQEGIQNEYVPRKGTNCKLRQKCKEKQVTSQTLWAQQHPSFSNWQNQPDMKQDTEELSSPIHHSNWHACNTSPVRGRGSEWNKELARMTSQTVKG